MTFGVSPTIFNNSSYYSFNMIWFSFIVDFKLKRRKNNNNVKLFHILKKLKEESSLFLILYGIFKIYLYIFFLSYASGSTYVLRSFVSAYILD